MLKLNRKYILLAITVVIAIAASVWLRSHIFSNMGVTLHQKIQSLNLSGFNVRYDSIAVNWIGNVIEIDNLLLEKNAYDTTCVYPEYISADKVRVEGIALIQLVFRNVLNVESVHVDGLRVLIRENSLMQLDSAAKRENEFTLDVEDVILTRAQLTYLDSSHCELITGINGHISLNDLKMHFRVDEPFKYEAQAIVFDSVEVNVPGHFYTINTLKAEMNFARSTFRADTIRLIPQLSKADFGKKFGYEIDRFEAVIPFFQLDNLSFSLMDTTRVKADVAEIQFYLKVFRDKRLPFLRKAKLLPLAMLQDLPFSLMIDSLKVTKSYVEYEEIAEGTTEAGKVFFDDLYAVLLDVDNTARTGNMRLSANARLFGQGDLSLFATFPFQKNRRSSVKGSIRNFDIPKINAMLTPTTQMKIESGAMKELSFGFTFNAYQSDGEIELNYEDLKIVSFKEEPKNGDKPQKDNLKTFIMNAFIFRKNMDEDVPEEKRKGTVMYQRDNTRSIFNFWVKSLVSGIKSAYNLDKTEARQSEKEIKKELRQERREAKRAKRAEKKRERG